MELVWLVLGGIGSVWGGTGWYLVVIGHYRLCSVEAVTGRYWLVLGGAGSVEGSAGWYLVVLGQYNLVLLGIKW